MQRTSSWNVSVDWALSRPRIAPCVSPHVFVDYAALIAVQSTMRDNKVVMRGEAGTRRTWRLSHLSEVFSQRSSRASLEAAVDTPPSAVSAFFRRLSLLVNAIPSPAASSSEAEAPVVPEKTITSPPRSPGPSSPLRQSHLRQRSNGSLNASSATRDGSLSPRRTLTSVKEAVV